MSKKKNTLKDLDEFLKQQAAILAPPERLSEATEQPSKSTETLLADQEISAEQLIEKLQELLQKKGVDSRNKLYSLILDTLGSIPESLPEDKMLINTVLYLKNPDQWKETIRQYWKNKG
jgi:hypothetical protein